MHNLRPPVGGRKSKSQTVSRNVEESRNQRRVCRRRTEDGRRQAVSAAVFPTFAVISLLATQLLFFVSSIFGATAKRADETESRFRKLRQFLNRGEHRRKKWQSIFFFNTVNKNIFLCY